MVAEGTFCPDAEDLLTVQVRSQIVVNNVFTPNGDGFNDQFLIQLGPVEQYRLLIYNRWGRLVFETTDASESWDGSYKGKSVSEGVYTFRLEAIKSGGENLGISGTVTLLR